MGPQEQFTDVLKAIVKKKLEQVVEDNILLAGKGKLTDLNLVQYEKLAREQGFTEAAEDLSDLVSMFGSSFIEHLRAEEQSKKQERNYPERRLEDYLTATPERLNLIEKGLKLVDRQYETKSGILDIFAKDASDKDVVIELKMGKYDNQKVITQIEKYLNDKPDARLIFVAPYISSTVFYKFKPLIDKGQITFYKVAEKGQDYSITSEDGKNIPMPKKIQFKGKQKQNGPVVYEIFNTKKPKSAPRQKKQAEFPKETSAVDNFETIPQGTFHETQPEKTYYMLVRKNDGLPGSVEITETQRKGLYDLLETPGIDKAREKIEIFEEKREFSLRSADLKHKTDKINSTDKQNLLQLFKNKQTVDFSSISDHLTDEEAAASSILFEVKKRAQKGGDFVLNIYYNYTHGKATLEQLREGKEKFKDFLESISSSPKYQKAVEILMKSENEHPTEGRGAKLWDTMRTISIQSSLIGYLEVKLNRASELSTIHKGTAVEYLKNYPLSFEDQSDENAKTFIIFDNDYYREFLEGIIEKSPRIEKAEVTPESLKNQPRVYQVLSITRPFLADKKTYLSEQKTISRTLKKNLEALLAPVDLLSAMHEYELDPHYELDPPVKNQNSKELWKDQTRRITREEADEIAKLREAIHKFSRAGEIFEDLESSMYSLFDSYVDNNYTESALRMPELLEQVQQKHRSEITEKKYSKEAISMSALVNNRLKTAKPAEKAYLQTALSIFGLHDHDMYNTFIAVKIARARKLIEADKELGMAYLGFSPMMRYRLENLENTGVYDMQNTSMTPQRKYEFIQADTELYKQILPCFVAAPENGTSVQPAPDNKPAYMTASPQQTGNPLQEALFREVNGSATPEVRLRMDYFIQDASALLPPDKTTQLGEVFEQFKLARKFRKREIQPTDVKIRNFFDDVTLQYIRKGEVPDADTLERLYERA